MELARREQLVMGDLPDASPLRTVIFHYDDLQRRRVLADTPLRTLMQYEGSFVRRYASQDNIVRNCLHDYARAQRLTPAVHSSHSIPRPCFLQAPNLVGQLARTLRSPGVFGAGGLRRRRQIVPMRPSVVGLRPPLHLRLQVTRRSSRPDTGESVVAGPNHTRWNDTWKAGSVPPLVSRKRSNLGTFFGCFAPASLETPPLELEAAAALDIAPKSCKHPMVHKIPLLSHRS